MLSAALRLGSSAQITQTLKSGRRYSSEYLVIHVNPIDGLSAFAFAVSKKVGNSVIRHRLTRQLRHIVHDNLAVLPPNIHVVVRALPHAHEASFAQLDQAFKQAFAKVKA
mgnify:CR=1 FL=1